MVLVELVSLIQRLLAVTDVGRESEAPGLAVKHHRNLRSRRDGGVELD